LKPDRVAGWPATHAGKKAAPASKRHARLPVRITGLPAGKFMTSRQELLLYGNSHAAFTVLTVCSV